MTHNIRIRKKTNAKIISSLVTISLVSILIFTAIPVSACHYTVDTFESNYTTPKDSFFKGEVVYGRGNAYGYNYPMKLRIRDPAGNVVYYSEQATTVVYGSYLLNGTAPTGTWNIQLGAYISGAWQWSTGSGRIAYFTVNDINFTLNVNSDGNGSVTVDPEQDTYPYGTLVNLTATPDSGYSFSNWTGDLDSSDNPTSIIMDSDKNITANFIQDQYELTVNINGNGNVIIDPEQDYYIYDTLVNLTATPDPGYSFSHWSGGITGSDNPTSIIMDSDKTVTAHFTQNQYTLTVIIDGNGTVTKNPDQPTYVYGDNVELTANADPGWTFSHWTGDLSGSNNPENIVMDGGKSVTAYFTEEEYNLNVLVDGDGSVVKDPDQAVYSYGTIIELTALADPGWTFSHWSGDLDGSDNPASIIMDSDKTVTAHFTQNQYTLTINTIGSGSAIIEPEQNNYTYGQIVNLTATPNSGYKFSHWSGDLSDAINPVAINMTEDKNITAHFTVKSKGGGSNGGGSTSSKKSNKPPVANLSAGEPYIGFVNEEIEFNGSFSYDLDGKIVEYTWDFGDETNADGETITHIYSSPGEYIVILKVKDNDRATDTDETIAVIIQPNRPPSDPTISGPSEGFINVEYNFSIVSSDDDNDAIKYVVDWGDGTFDESDFLPPGSPFDLTHKWTKTGNFTIIVSADDNETVSIDETTITIDEPDIPEEDNFILLLLLLLALIILLIVAILAKRKKDKKKEENKKKK
jgi:uncharacterized repeat protein (TIGR02543 family)